MNLHMFADGSALAAAVANEVIDEVERAIAERGECHLVLAGGTTPRLCYEHLRHAELAWSSLHLWFGDERCLPVGDEQRNDTMAMDAWLNHVPIPPENIHSIATEQGAKTAAMAYSKALQSAPIMDLVLLGMGEDGHTASLFPHHPGLQDDAPAIAVHHAPKPPADRVSLSFATLNAARRRIVMVAGEGKRNVWQNILTGKAEEYPVGQLLNPMWFSTLS